ncbi:MAG: ferrochelatase [Gemmatimonadota bacterium]
MGVKHGVVLLGYGEPERASRAAVGAYLERIFTSNARLYGTVPALARQRARRRAAARAPELMREYERIGGSPHDEQLRRQAESLDRVLRLRGLDAPVFVAKQYTEPSIGQAVACAKAAAVERLVAVPTYPFAGPSTTDAALAELTRRLDGADGAVELSVVPRWHQHPTYIGLRAEAVRRTARRAGISPADARVRLVFCAHGTPLELLDGGSRYLDDVEDHCAAVVRELDVSGAVLGYQNHEGGAGVAWTEPSIEEVIEGLDADAAIVDPVSFMHEQSETLWALDYELSGRARASGLRFYRVPVPWIAPAFIDLLADLVEARIAAEPKSVVAGGAADAGGAITRPRGRHR